MYWKSATLYWRGRETWKNVNFCSLLTLTCPCLPTKIGKSGKSALFLLLSYSVKWLWNFFQLLKEIVYQHSYSWIICLAIKKLKTNVIKKLLKICSFFFSIWEKFAEIWEWDLKKCICFVPHWLLLYLLTAKKDASILCLQN